MSNALSLWKNGTKIASLLPTVEAEVVLDDKGVGGATLNYTCLYDRAVSVVSQLKKHPDYPWLKRKQARIIREEAGAAKVTVTFEGISPEAEGDDNKTYSVDGTLSTEPVESHPKFKEIAGEWNDPTTWKNGAKFVVHGEDRGRFLGFTQDPEQDKSPKAGMRSVPTPGLIYTEEEVRSSTSSGALNADMAKLGKIDTPPNSPFLPTLPTGYDWMLWSCNSTQIGDGARIRRSWRASGPNGWDPDFFTD